MDKNLNKHFTKEDIQKENAPIKYQSNQENSPNEVPLLI